MAVTHSTFSQRLLAWFEIHGRYHLPWQNPRTPYRVWLSEIMLQQTQVATVIPYFQRFVQSFPDVKDLAAADNDYLMAHWAGLGYYARARNLQAAATYCVQHYNGELPCDFAALCALPGIGRSTAGAILAQAWSQPFAILDGNVKRVLARYHAIKGYPGKKEIENQLWEIASAHVQYVLPENIADYTQAQMDLGATICTRHKPACLLCPLQSGCSAYAQNLVDVLPTPKPSKTLPQRDAIALLLENENGQILLQKRPPVGIWANLWTLPQASTADELQHWFKQTIIGNYQNAQALAPITHTFSHYRLHLKLLYLRGITLRPQVNEDNLLRCIPYNKLAQLGLPAPIRKLLDSRQNSC